MLIFEPLISRISLSRQAEMMRVAPLSFFDILFCASELAPSEYLKTLADYRLLIISTQRAKIASPKLTQRNYAECMPNINVLQKYY